MSDFADAFQELREEFDRSTGRKNGVRINGKFFRAIVEEVTFEDIVAADGNGEAGGFRAMVAVSDHPKKPTQGDPIESDGLEVSILSAVKTNGVTWTIIAGDIASE